MRGGGASKCKAGSGQPDLPVKRLLLQTGRPVTPPNDWWRTKLSAGGHDVGASSEPARGKSSLQGAAPNPSGVNSRSKRRRVRSQEGEPRRLKPATCSDSRGPGDAYSFPADLSDANASSQTMSANPPSTKRGGAAVMGPQMSSPVAVVSQGTSMDMPGLSASMEGTSNGHHRHSGSPLARPMAKPANMEPLAICRTQPRDSRTVAEGQLSNTAGPTQRKGVSRTAGDVDESQGGMGEQPPGECPAARVLRTGRMSQVPAPWWVGSPVDSTATACCTLPPSSPPLRVGTRASRLASTAKLDSQPQIAPSPADMLPRQTGEARPRRALPRATPGEEWPRSEGHIASPLQKKRRLLRQPIANIVRRTECEFPLAQLPMEAAPGEGHLLQEAPSPSQGGQAGDQELLQQVATSAPDTCQTETLCMLGSNAHARSSPSPALPADATRRPLPGLRSNSASQDDAALSREPQTKGGPCLRPQPSWQSGASRGASSAGLQPVSPPAGQGMRRAAASRSSVDRMATQDSVGVDTPPSLSASVDSGEHVSDERPSPSDCHHMPAERACAALHIRGVSTLPDNGEGGRKQHPEAQTGDRAASKELPEASFGAVPEGVVIAEMGEALASASPHADAFRKDKHAALKQAQPEDSALQVEPTATPIIVHCSVTSTTSAGAAIAPGLTTPCRNCSPPGTCLPGVCSLPEAGHRAARSVRQRSPPGPAANSDLCRGTASPVSPGRPLKGLTAPQGKLGLARESMVQHGAQDNTPHLTGPAGNLRARKRVGDPVRPASLLQCSNSSACHAAHSTPAALWPGGCAPRDPVSSDVPVVDPVPLATTPSPAANPTLHSTVTSPGSPDLQSPKRRPANTNQASALPCSLTAAQRLRNLQRFSGNVPTDEGDRDGPSTSSISIGGTPVRDLQACATSGEPCGVDEEPLEHSDGLEALAAQLTPSGFQFLQETLAEVEALEFCNTKA